LSNIRVYLTIYQNRTLLFSIRDYILDYLSKTKNTETKNIIPESNVQGIEKPKDTATTQTKGKIKPTSLEDKSPKITDSIDNTPEIILSGDNSQHTNSIFSSS
jgi:hypothetical protein